MAVFLHTNSPTVNALAVLMHQRLLGAFLGCPFDTRLGERPEDILIADYKKCTDEQDHEALTLFQGAIQQLARERVTPLLDQAFVDQDVARLVDQQVWLDGFFRLLDNTTAIGIERLLFRWLANLHDLSTAYPVAQALFLALAHVAMRHLNIERSPHLRGFMQGTMYQGHLSTFIASLCAQATPLFFVRSLLPEYLDNVTAQPPLPDKRVLTGWLRQAIASSFEAGRKARRQPAIIALQYLMKRPWTNPKLGQLVRDSIVKAATLTHVASRQISLLEQAYWSGQPPRDPLQEDGSYAKLVSKWCQKARAGARLPRPKELTELRFNQLPFAEAAYCYLFARLLPFATGMPVRAKHVPWDRVGDSLFVKRDIAFAIHNDSIQQQIEESQAQSYLMRSAYTLFTFKRYDILCNVKWLRRLIAAGGLAKSVLEGVNRVLQGRPLDTTGGEAAEVFGALFERGRIAVVDDSDFKACIRDFAAPLLGQLDETRVLDTQSSDEGLEHLVDGHVAMYVGGAIHSRYACRTYRHRVRVLAHIPREVSCSFWVHKEIYQREKEVFDRLGPVWLLANQLWDRVRDPKRRVGKSARPFMQALRAYILQEVNSTREIASGFARSFAELDDMLRQHNSRIPSPEDSYQMPFEPVATRSHLRITTSSQSVRMGA